MLGVGEYSTGAGIREHVGGILGWNLRIYAYADPGGSCYSEVAFDGFDPVAHEDSNLVAAPQAHVAEMSSEVACASEQLLVRNRAVRITIGNLAGELASPAGEEFRNRSYQMCV
jgi:hypothetical protein